MESFNPFDKVENQAATTGQTTKTTGGEQEYDKEFF